MLAASVDLELELVETESPVDDYAVDLCAKGLNAGHWIVIENQLEESDHNHLRLVMAYAVGEGAGVII